MSVVRGPLFRRHRVRSQEPGARSQKKLKGEVARTVEVVEDVEIVEIVIRWVGWFPPRRSSPDA